MVFESIRVRGKGRGKPMGFPTINLRVPIGFDLNGGVYAAKVTIEKRTFLGALHYGPIPTFGDAENNLEVYLIDVPVDTTIQEELENLGDKIIKVKIVKFLRKVIKFKSVASLVRQIGKDVADVRTVLS